MPKKSGFTLVELLIVISIISIVSGIIILIINPIEVTKRARDNKRKSDLQLLAKSLNQYLFENEYYPPSVNAGISPWECGLTVSSWSNCDLLQTELNPFIAPIPYDPQDKVVIDGNTDCSSAPCYMYRTDDIDHQKFCICANLENPPVQTRPSICPSYGNYCIASGTDIASGSTPTPPVSTPTPAPTSSPTPVPTLTPTPTPTLTPTPVPTFTPTPTPAPTSTPTPTPTPAPSCPATNLAGYWKLNDGSGTTALDSGPGGYNLTVNGGALWDAGKFGGGLSFDGINDYAQRLSTSALFPANVTVSSWFRVNVFTSNKVIASSAASDYRWGVIRIISDGAGTGHLQWFFWPQSGSQTTINSPTSGLTTGAGAWYHFAATFDDTANLAKFYINGSPVNAGVSAPDIAFSGTYNFYIGSTNGLNFFNGSIDEVRIYNRALTDSEVTDLYNCTPAP